MCEVVRAALQAEKTRRHLLCAMVEVTVHVNVDIRLNQASPTTVCVPNGTSD